ncbi:hypothetical protein [Chryseobacterium indologenes]|uniref:hypothetical protein n=1 Tax=Chryseobacterium indologenes TaxID=253 RepID=UPI0007881486|nr:hypothetical protein [Chryseobacterium indologenes]
MEGKKYTIDDIRTLDLTEHVRLRPQMYFYECFSKKNLNPLVADMLCHAVDEYLDNNCNKIIIGINDNLLLIEYNAGMSLKESQGLTSAECIMTKISACSNQKKHLEIGAEFCLLGMATINAASERCELKTNWNMQRGHFIFENGSTVFNEISPDDISEESTKISFRMSHEVFGELKFEWTDLQHRLDILSEKLPNLKIELYKL